MIMTATISLLSFLTAVFERLQDLHRTRLGSRMTFDASMHSKVARHFRQ